MDRSSSKHYVAGTRPMTAYFKSSPLFLILDMNVCFKCVHACSASGSQKRVWGSLEMQLQAFVSDLAWVLGAKCALNCRAISPASFFPLCLKHGLRSSHFELIFMAGPPPSYAWTCPA